MASSFSDNNFQSMNSWFSSKNPSRRINESRFSSKTFETFIRIRIPTWFETLFGFTENKNIVDIMEQSVTVNNSINILFKTTITTMMEEYFKGYTGYTGSTGSTGTPGSSILSLSNTFINTNSFLSTCNFETLAFH